MGYGEQKGKFFTARVVKDTIRVVIGTQTHIIHGLMYVMPDLRLKDDLNKGERFVAVTEAEVFDLNNQTRLLSHDMLVLNRDAVIWIVPFEENPPGHEEGAPQ